MAELLINAGTYSRLIRLVLVYIAVDSSANVLGLEVWKLEDGCAERDILSTLLSWNILMLMLLRQGTRKLSSYLKHPLRPKMQTKQRHPRGTAGAQRILFSDDRETPQPTSCHKVLAKGFSAVQSWFLAT